MQPGAESDVARVFVVPYRCTLSIDGGIRKDPSAENGRTVEVRVMQNDRQIWPESGWTKIEPDADKTVECHLGAVPAAAGDLLRFVVHRTGNAAADPIVWDPTIVLGIGVDVAPRGLIPEQRMN